MKRISVVTPCFNEEDNVRPCYDELKRVFDELLPGYEREHIFVDNASTDATMAELRKLAAEDPFVKVIWNARNYGPFRSSFNALRYCTGDAILVLLAADNQDPPTMLPVFVRHWEEGYKIVYGIRARRQESGIMRACRWLFYRLVYVLSDIRVPVDAGEFQLIDKEVHKALIDTHDYYPYTRGLIADCGYYDRTIGVSYPWAVRHRGLSKSRLFVLLDQAINGVISFTAVPLRLATFAGFFIAAVSLIYALVSLSLLLLSPHPNLVPGIPTLIVALFFFSGVQLFFIGIVGEYIGAVHSQVRRGNKVIVRETLNLPTSAAL
jgi:glycosyltransferase involved in cell wall biosynthesis